jgi:dolichol-phosphate mannosyltransferase
VQTPENPTPVSEEKSLETGEESPSGVSVILFEDVFHQGKLIGDTRTYFQNQNIPAEFIVISAEGPRLAPLSEAQQTHSVQSLDIAVRSAKFERIAIIDAVYEFDEAHWNIGNPTCNTETFRSWSFRPTRAPGSRKILAWFYCLITRALLGVQKNRLAPGFVTCPKSLLSKINLHRLDHQFADSVSQLLAVARLKGHRVEQYTCQSRQPETQWTKTNSADPHLPKSKSIKRSIGRNLQFWFSELAFPGRPSKSSQSISPWKHIAATAVILLMAAFILFANSGYPLFEPDETRNAQLAMNILESGNWISLSLDGEPYWDKPPLLAWMTAVSYQCFGVSEFTTRLPSILSSLVLLGFMIAAGSKLTGFRPAAFAAVAMLLAWGFTFQARYVTMDALLTLFTTMVTLGVAVGVSAKGNRKFSRGWLITSGIALGLGILAKGPICLVLTVPPLFAWMFLNRQVRGQSVVAATKLLLVPAVLVAVPWFVVTSIRSPEFVSYFLWKHHVLRFSDAFNHQEPFWYYLPILWLFMFPASILLPRAIQFILSSKQKYRMSRLPAHGLLAISAFWIVGFFSLSQCKLPAYVLPAFPLIALLTGVIFNLELKQTTALRSRFDRLPKRIAIGVSVLSLIVSALIMYQFENYQASVVLACAVVVSIALVVRYSIKRSTKRNTSWVATAAIGMLFVFLGVNHLVPTIAKDRSILSSLSQLGQNRKSIPIIYFGRDAFGSDLYLPGKSIVKIDEEALSDMEAKLLKQPQSTIVASDSNIDRIKEIFGKDITIEPAPGRHTFFASLSPERIAAARQPNRTQK